MAQKFKNINDLLPNIAKARKIMESDKYEKRTGNSQTTRQSPVVSNPDVINETQQVVQQAPVEYPEREPDYGKLPPVIAESFKKQPPVSSPAVSGSVSDHLDLNKLKEYQQQVNPPIQQQPQTVVNQSPVQHYNNVTPPSADHYYNMIKELEFLVDRIKKDAITPLNESIDLGDEDDTINFVKDGFLYECVVVSKKKINLKKRR